MMPSWHQVNAVHIQTGSDSTENPDLDRILSVCLSYDACNAYTACSSMFFYVLLCSSCLPGVSLQANLEHVCQFGFVKQVLKRCSVVSLASQTHKHCEEKGQAHVSLHQPAERVQDQPEADSRHETSWNHLWTSYHSVIYLNMCELQRGPCWSIIYSGLFAALLDSLHSRNITQRLSSLNIRILSCNIL